jgi:hypothetical protein
MKVRPRETIQALRWKLVKQYSRLNLTKEEDKLQAIQGIAEKILRSRPQRILSGLLEEELIRDMCWRCDELGQKPKSWVAPSWSWACTDSDIRFGWETRYYVHADVLSIEADDSGEDDRAIVTAHKLTLAVALYPGTIEYLTGRDSLGLARIVFVDRDKERTLETNERLANMDLGKLSHPFFNPDSHCSLGDQAYLPNGTAVLCAFLLSFEGILLGDTCGYAIKIRPVEGDNLLFCRVGCCDERIDYGVKRGQLEAMLRGIEKSIITLV